MSPVRHIHRAVGNINDFLHRRGYGAGRGHGGGGSENDRVNNMTEQQFMDHMNELHLRDNEKPIKLDVLS